MFVHRAVLERIYNLLPRDHVAAEALLDILRPPLLRLPVDILVLMQEDYLPPADLAALTHTCTAMLNTLGHQHLYPNDINDRLEFYGDGKPITRTGYCATDVASFTIELQSTTATMADTLQSSPNAMKSITKSLTLISGGQGIKVEATESPSHKHSRS